MTEKVIYETRGTCSREIIVEIENDKILNVEFIGGCNGNLKGISSLLAGMEINDAISKLKGITCGPKSTSCPDQLAVCLQEYVVKKSKTTV